MSGGHYDYTHQRIESLAADIEADFANEGYYEVEDWFNYLKPMIKCDRLDDPEPLQRVVILDEIQELIKDLRWVAKRAEALDRLLSGDTGPTSYLEELATITMPNHLEHI